MEEIANYQELGLTKNESKVYKTLIEFGKLGAGEISGRSGVTYSKIYNVLSSLVNKGLVEIIPEKTKKFVPSDPQALIEFIEKKQKKLEEAKERTKGMKKFYDVREKNPVVMELGRKGFYKIVKDLKDVNDYEYSVKYTSESKPEWLRNAKIRLKSGKDVRSLTRFDEKTEKDVRKWIKVNKNIRKIKNNGVAMDIRDDKEVMIALINSNVTLLIKDPTFAKIMKTLFLGAYDKAEKIK